MEPPPQEQQPQPQPQQAWRGDESGSKQSPEADKRRHIIDKLKTKYPKRNMNLKAMVLNDLLSNFKPRSGDHHGDCCEERIKDRFHFVKKKETKKKNKRKVEIFYSPGRLNRAVTDLVTQIKSPMFGIQPDPSEFDINRGILTFSCFDKTPREPLPEVNISEENSPESRLDVTKKIENCSIDGIDSDCI